MEAAAAHRPRQAQGNCRDDVRLADGAVGGRGEAARAAAPRAAIPLIDQGHGEIPRLDGRGTARACRRRHHRVYVDVHLASVGAGARRVPSMRAGREPSLHRLRLGKRPTRTGHARLRWAVTGTPATQAASQLDKQLRFLGLEVSTKAPRPSMRTSRRPRALRVPARMLPRRSMRCRTRCEG